MLRKFKKNFKMFVKEHWSKFEQPTQGVFYLMGSIRLVFGVLSIFMNGVILFYLLKYKVSKKDLKNVSLFTITLCVMCVKAEKV